MRISAALCGLALLILSPATAGPVTATPHRPQHVTVAVNIEVPVLVLRKDAFVDTLTLADFEVFEDGVRQPVEGVYLIRDRKVLREERTPGAAPPRPRAVRHYVLSIDLKEYLPKIGEALDYFFDKVLGPEDTLAVITPARTYRLSRRPWRACRGRRSRSSSSPSSRTPWPGCGRG